jgi:CPA2 family monovalent cation:H+ antiporter-2
MFVRLHSVTLGPDAAAVGKPLGGLELGAEISMIRRGKNRIEPVPDMTLEEGDVVVLRGTGEAVARAEARLLK